MVKIEPQEPEHIFNNLFCHRHMATKVSRKRDVIFLPQMQQVVTWQMPIDRKPFFFSPYDFKMEIQLIGMTTNR